MDFLVGGGVNMQKSNYFNKSSFQKSVSCLKENVGVICLLDLIYLYNKTLT